MVIYCCDCGKEVDARLTDGMEVYRHRKDLHSLPFWICKCGCFVGCHHKTKDRTRPLGCIPNEEIKNARKHIHAILDPLWKNGHFTRSYIYNYLKDELGYTYHTAELSDIEECRKVYCIIKNMYKGVNIE